MKSPLKVALAAIAALMVAVTLSKILLPRHDDSARAVLMNLKNIEQKRGEGMPRVLILGDAAAFHGINPRFYKDAESFAAPSFSIDDQLHILQRLLASGAKPRCILGAFSFGGTMEPELGAAEVKALGELLSLAKNQEIPFILLKVPFGKLVPAEESVSYWIKYEELLLASNGPFRLFAPPALPEEDFVDRRRVTYEGAKKIAAYLEPALVGTCYR